MSSAIIGIPPKNIWASFSNNFITFLISKIFLWFCSFKRSLYFSTSLLFLNFSSFILGFDFKFIIIPVVFPSSLITKFLKTGLSNISLNPVFIFIPSFASASNAGGSDARAFGFASPNAVTFGRVFASYKADILSGNYYEKPPYSS